MHNDEFEKRMRALEHFHSLRLPPEAWTVLRVDGRSFTRFTETGFEKPIDTRFQQMMRQTAQALLEELHGIYAYTESDEISVLFNPGWDLFDRELEKLVSISAAIASATFTHASQRIVHFDSRVWLGSDTSQVVDYFRWRQTDAERCALNGWCYWTLRQAGKSRTRLWRSSKANLQPTKSSYSTSTASITTRYPPGIVVAAVCTGKHSRRSATIRCKV